MRTRTVSRMPPPVPFREMSWLTEHRPLPTNYILGYFMGPEPTHADYYPFQVATQLLGEFLALQSDHAALLQRYVPRFQRVLPARKVARFYQVENKIRAILDYELARSIPLVK